MIAACTMAGPPDPRDGRRFIGGSPPLLHSACAVLSSILPGGGLGLSRCGERFWQEASSARLPGRKNAQQGLHCRLETGDEKLDRHSVEASLGDYDIGISLGRLHELQMHGAHDVEILVHN